MIASMQNLIQLFSDLSVLSEFNVNLGLTNFRILSSLEFYVNQALTNQVALLHPLYQARLLIRRLKQKSTLCKRFKDDRAFLGNLATVI